MSFPHIYRQAEVWDRGFGGGGGRGRGGRGGGAPAPAVGGLRGLARAVVGRVRRLLGRIR